jgi:hypothetical protein
MPGGQYGPKPRHAACVTIGVAFLSACTLDAPAPCVCALADNTIAPKTNAAVDKVIVSFLIEPPPPWFAESAQNSRRGAAIIRRTSCSSTAYAGRTRPGDT